MELYELPGRITGRRTRWRQHMDFQARQIYVCRRKNVDFKAAEWAGIHRILRDRSYIRDDAIAQYVSKQGRNSR